MTTPVGTAQVLVIANRTASTPLLLDEIASQSREGARFTVLIPTRHHDDWTAEVAQLVCGRAAGRDVATLGCGPDALDTIHAAVGKRCVRRDRRLDRSGASGALPAGGTVGLKRLIKRQDPGGTWGGTLVDAMPWGMPAGGRGSSLIQGSMRGSA
jgi:hypothetical protein